MEYYKQRFRKNLAQLLEEEAGEQEGEVTEKKSMESEAQFVGQVPYLAVQLPESNIPPRRLCAVCGFPRLMRYLLWQWPLNWPSFSSGL